MTPDKPPLSLVASKTQADETSKRGAASPTSVRRTQAAEKQRQAVQLRLYGYTFQAIADQLGYANRGIAQKAFIAGLERWGEKDTADLRAAEDARLDEALRVVAREMAKGNLYAVDRFLQIGRDRRKLHGLDMPVRVEVSGSLDVENALDRALGEEMATMAALMADREQAETAEDQAPQHA